MCKEYSEESLCINCKNDIKPFIIKTVIEEEGFKCMCYSMGYYSYTIKKLILALKFQKDFDAGYILSEYMSDFIKNNIKKDIDLITYIPSSKESLKKRGFNQCLYLSSIISEKCNIPCVNLLDRVHDVKDQIGLNNIKRWENVKGAFKAKKTTNIKDKTILIVDDVITTGATVFYAAKEIKEFGAKEVLILTVAKSRV